MRKIKKYQVALLVALVAVLVFGGWKIFEISKLKAQVSELQKYKNEQEQEKQIEKKQSEEAEIQKAQAQIEDKKQNQIRQCQEKQNNCASQIQSAKDSISSAKNNLARYEEQLKLCDKSYCNDDVLKYRKEDVATAKKSLSGAEANLSNLLNIECKDCQNPCE